MVEPKLAATTCGVAKTDACLSVAQAVALKAVYSGVRSASGVVLDVSWAWDVGIGGKGCSTYSQGWVS